MSLTTEDERVFLSNIEKSLDKMEHLLDLIEIKYNLTEREQDDRDDH